MKSFMDEKITARWFWANSRKHHSNRIKEIKSKTSNRIDNSPPRVPQILKSGSKFLIQERKNSIKSNNDKLLNVLIDISRGRRSTSTSLILDSAQALPKKKSLNMSSRKQEALKINSDNEAMARRLTKTTHGLSFKKLDQDWKNSVKYKKSISKARFRSLPNNDTSRKSTREKLQMRTRSLCEDPAALLNSELQHSPLIDSQKSELVFINDHKPSGDLLVKGQGRSRFLRSYEPIHINPPKTFIKLEPLTHAVGAKLSK